MKGLDEAVDDIVRIINGKPSDNDVNGSLWNDIVGSCDENSMPGKFYDLVEDVVNDYLSDITESDKRSIFSEIDVDQHDEDEIHYYPIESIEMDLGTELIQLVLNCAFEESDAIRQRKKSSRRIVNGTWE
ncbi:MAG: hypothetical protein HQM06_18105 [Magnetococcales bacterium]|nr:hypothetical protein [Magnetococcales bacterium]